MFTIKWFGIEGLGVGGWGRIRVELLPANRHIRKIDGLEGNQGFSPYTALSDNVVGRDVIDAGPLQNVTGSDIRHNAADLSVDVSVSDRIQYRLKGRTPSRADNADAHTTNLERVEERRRKMLSRVSVCCQFQRQGRRRRHRRAHTLGRPSDERRSPTRAQASLPKRKRDMQEPGQSIKQECSVTSS